MRPTAAGIAFTRRSACPGDRFEAAAEALVDLGRPRRPLAAFDAVLTALEGLGLLKADATFEEFERVIGEGKTPWGTARHVGAQIDRAGRNPYSRYVQREVAS